MKSFNKYFYFVLFVSILFLASTPCYALEQISNGDFSSGTTNWNPDSPLNYLVFNENFGVTGGYFEAYGSDLGGSANKQWHRDGYIYQVFPGSALASDSNIAINLSFREIHDYGQGTWEANLNGSIFTEEATPNLIQTFLNYQSSGDISTTAAEEVWQNMTEQTVFLPEGNQYRLRIKFDLLGWKQNESWLYVDDISCNMSPSGLTASETTSSGCYLNWHDSTGSPGLDYYRIYRKTSLSDSWTQIATPTNSNFTDTSPTPADAVYYAVSDVDTGGTESPLSPHATYRTAKLVITKVEASPNEVTIGQSGIPIKVYISNTGYTPMSVDEVDLYFSDPAIGVYTVTQTSSLPVNVGSESSTIVEFSIDVLDGSNPDTDIIDAIATGTNLQTGVTLTDTEADDNHSWLIRAPANLVIQTITVPSTVYRDQKDVPVSIEVLNDGDKNAAAYWESSNLLFSSGSYSNIRVVDSMPVTVYSGLTKTVDYLVDIDVDCATGPCTVDAEISFRDVNLLISSTNYDGAAVPGEWNVVAGVIKTYKGPPTYPSYTIEADSFNQGDSIVYASAANLIPLYEYRMRWYDPSSTQVRVTDPPLTTDSNGVINDEYQLTGASPLGEWTIDVTNVNTTTPLAQTTFRVVDPATISVELVVPDYVTLDQDFVATMTVTNSGGAMVSDATPGNIVKLAGNTGDATLSAGPTPATSNIDGSSTQEFTFSYNANTVGSFTIKANATGYDDNDSTFLTAATDTSNMCIIQTKPVLTVNSVTEAYDLVYRNQTGLTVEMEIQNAGEAAVYVDAASLSFSVGDYTQSIASPAAMPFLLDGNTTTTFVFTVNVDIDSPSGLDTISGSFSAYEANDNDSTFAISGGTTGEWEVLTAAGKCSANSEFDPEQYEFRESMTVFFEFSGLAVNTSHVFRVYDDETAGTEVDTSGVMKTNATSGTLGYQSDIAAAPIIGKWRVEIWTTKNDNNPTPEDLQGVQYFDVVNAGNLVTSLNISPDSVELGDEITLTMSVSNTVANSSTIYPATPSSPLKTGASTGDISLVSGPSPASATISYGSPATFTWIYDTTADTGVGSLTLTAYATGIDSVTTNAETVEGVTSNTSLSNRLLILSRNLELASATLDLGEVVCGQTVTVRPRLDNTGNTSLESVNWQKALPTLNGYNIPYAYFSFSPESGFSVATFTNQLSSFTLTMPYNQYPGTYVATMTVFDDLNTSGARDLGEPFDMFGVEVTASESKVVVASDKVVDLGGWPNDVWVATQTFQAFNGGNLELDNLEFTQLNATFTDSQIFVTPMTYGSLATDSILTASISAYIGAAEAPSTYIATWSVYDATDTYASDTFQIIVSVGTKDYTFTPDPFHIGNGTPTRTIYDQNFTINNTGTLNITNLAVTPKPLENGANTISEDNIFFEIPQQIAPGESKTATVTLYVPGGTAQGDFEGLQWFFDDQNGDGVNSGEANEVEKNMLLQVHINPYFDLQVIPSTVDLGGLAPGEPPKSVGFLCKNSGNETLASMTWQKTDILYDAFTIPQASYTFIPTPYFSAPAGDIFTATITIQIGATQEPGNYTGSFAWLYDDQLWNGTIDGSDPNDSFKVTCQVGAKEIQITTTGPLETTGTPNSASSDVTYSIKNIGTLILTKPKAKLTADLVEQTDPSETVPAGNAIFSPELFPYINPGQSKSGTWAMDIPAGQAIGTYTGTLKVWDDTDGDGVPDTTEASDTVDVELSVTGKRVLTASPDPLDLFFVAAGKSGTGEFIISNTGNMDISKVLVETVPLDPTFSGPDPIDSITFDLPTALTNGLLVGESEVATVTVNVPLGQTSGAYEGYQRFYVDYNPANDDFNVGEEYVDMLLKLTVGEKQVSVTNPVNCGSGDTGTTVSKSFTVSNPTSIPLSKLKWSLADLATDSYTLPETPNITFSYPGPFSISSNGSRDVTVYVDIPSSQPPGEYTAEQTVFEDENSDGSVNSLEASATFDLYVTVNETPGLNILTSSLDLGTVNAGETSSEFAITYQNNGNVPLTNLDWIERNLTGAGTIDSGKINIVATAPVGTLNPGQTAIATLTLEIPSDQAAGVYSGLQTLRDTSYPATASDSFNLIVTVESDSGVELALASGTLYQQIATDTFDNVTDETLILSSWIAPGTCSAKLSFVEASPNASITRSITIDSSGNLTTSGAITDAGIAGRATSEYNGSDPNIVSLNWYRVYFRFDYHFDSSVASHTYVVMENANSGPKPCDVWFDGVQLEKANFSNQTGPAPYNPKLKIISPTSSTDVQGGRKYYEW